MVTVPSFAQFADDLRIVHEDTRSAVIEFVPRFFNGFKQGNTDTLGGAIEFYGALYEQGRPGSSISAYRAATVAIPSPRYSMQILVSEYHELSNIEPRVYPVLKQDDMGFVHVQDSSPRDARREYVHHDLIELVDLATEQQHVEGTLKFFPVQYVGGGKARAYTRIVVRLDFDAHSGGVSINPLLNESSRTLLAETGSAKGPVTDSPLAQGDWYRLDVKEAGIYKLDRDFFTRNGIPVSGNINSIRIFGNGGNEVPEDLSAPRPNGLEEVARLVVDRNGNGQFDSDDFVLFYGDSTVGWRYNPQLKAFNHFINHYTDTNSYFLTLGGVQGKTMDSIASTNNTGVFSPTDFQARFVNEEELFNGVKSGRQWVGRFFDETLRSQTYTNLLSGVVTAKPVLYRFVLLSRSATVDTFRVFENNQQVGAPIFTFPIDVSSTAIENEWQYVTPVISVNRTGDLPNDRSVLRFAFGLGNSNAKGWVDWFEILYRRRFEAVNDFLQFTSPDTTAVTEYNLTKFSSRDVYLFDVTDHRKVRRIVNLTFNPADATVFKFQVQQTSGGVREFIAVGPNGFKSPRSVKKIANSNLHGVPDGADFVIISPPEFLTAANRLKTHRERPGIDFLKTMVVSVESIFNEFAGGLPDPMGIRDFLKYATTAWPMKPRYVLLLGDGSYDYKDRLNRRQRDNWIIPYESFNSIHQIETYSSDDHFVFLEPNNPRVSLALGRLPVRSLAEADSMISKIINYETTAPFGSWRNRITFVGDDGLTSRYDEGSLHTGQADLLAQSYTPTIFDRRKIYLIEYPTVTSATGRRKPDVNKAVVEAINNGTLIINYTGHGNPHIWAHERIFGDEEDFPKLTNYDKHCMLIASTCDFARWDEPSDRSAGEKILTDMRAGAIAVVTSIRVVYSFENSVFNNTLFSFLLQKDSLNRPPRIGDAMKATKRLLFSLNDLKYHLLGDPTMRLATPRAPATIDSLAGRSTTRLVQLPTLGRVALNGEVKQTNGSRWSDFNGRALIEVFDAKRTVVIPEWGNFSFEVNGSLLYRGEISVSNGFYQGTFPIPKDVSYGQASARVSVYAWSNLTDGIGYTENVRIAGTDTTAAADTTGPQLRVYVDSDAFRPGDFVKPDARLVVDLFDQSGINTSTAGIGHRLEAVLSTRPQPIDLTEYYRGNLDTFQSGQVAYPLTGLQEGRHFLTVRAWDIHNNSSKAETYFEVRAATDAAIFNVLNFPNPFSSSTVFTFQRNSFEPIDVEIKIYTVAGRLVEHLEVPSVTDRFAQIPWAGRDREGSELANGVYFYKVLTRSLDRQRVNEVLGKLTVLR